MASLALGVKFIPTAGGAGDFTYLAQVGGYVSPTSALVDGKSYRYRAENSTLTEWEFGTGTWSSSLNTLSRDTIAASSTGSKVTFTAAPQIGIVIFPEDVLTPDGNLASLIDPDAALGNLGGTVTGKALFTSANADAALGNLGGTTTGKALFTSADVNAVLAMLGSDLPWYARGIGEIVYVDTSIAGVSTPPQSHADLVYIELTAGKTGSGQFNEGKLTSESVTGSAPLVVATSVISVSGSPINGKTIHLLNTEGRILRPSTSAGTLQNDQMQQITGNFTTYAGGINTASGAFSKTGSGFRTDPTISIANGVDFDSANSPSARAGNETRMKNIAVTAYMRVK